MSIYMEEKWFKDTYLNKTIEDINDVNISYECKKEGIWMMMILPFTIKKKLNHFNIIKNEKPINEINVHKLTSKKIVVKVKCK